MINYSNRVHGFDAYFDNETTRQIIKTTLEFWKVYKNNNNKMLLSLLQTQLKLITMEMSRNSLAIITVLSMSLTSCQNKQMKEELTRFKQLENKEASNIETVKQFYMHLDKFLDEQERNAFMNLWSSDSKRFTGSSDESMSMEDMTPFLKTWYTAFPDLKHHIINVIAKNDYVVVQVKYTGTQMNEFMGIPATQKKIECKGIHIFKLVAGKITELHSMDDDFTMFQQLGHELK
jgi:steroid delta-isomerase-like uncharacterized protein